MLCALSCHLCSVGLCSNVSKGRLGGMWYLVCGMWVPVALRGDVGGGDSIRACRLPRSAAGVSAIEGEADRLHMQSWQFGGCSPPVMMWGVGQPLGGFSKKKYPPIVTRVGRQLLVKSTTTLLRCELCTWILHCNCHTSCWVKPSMLSLALHHQCLPQLGILFFFGLPIYHFKIGAKDAELSQEPPSHRQRDAKSKATNRIQNFPSSKTNTLMYARLCARACVFRYVRFFLRYLSR